MNYSPKRNIAKLDSNCRMKKNLQETKIPKHATKPKNMPNMM